MRTMDNIFWIVMGTAFLAVVIGEIQYRIDEFNKKHKGDK